MDNICATCLSRIEDENAPILTMGAYGTPKCLCPSCAALVETITLGRDYDEISAAMATITEKMSKANVDDMVTVKTMTELLAESAERAEKIKEGTYDFDLDEESEEEKSFEEIPEELQETEEDRLLDEKEAESLRKFDKFLNWAWLGVGIFALGVIIWKLIEKFA